MQFFNKTIRLSASAALLGLGLTLVACGGGGGGNSGPTGITYTGKTEQSNVDDTNTQTYSTAILDGSQDSQQNFDAIAGGAVLASDGETTQKNKQHAMLTTLIEQIKNNIENTTNSGPAIVTGFIPTPSGDCGGTSSVITSNNTNYTLTYNAYCSTLLNGTVTMNGTVTASVTLDAFNNFSAINISFNRFTMTFVDSSNATFTNEFSGTIAVNLTATGGIGDMTLTINFVENGKVYQLADMIYSTSGSLVSISGTIYHPDHGYITFVTNSAFELVDDELCGGVLSATGANGSNFTITVDPNCTSYTYTGTDALGNVFNGSF